MRNGTARRLKKVATAQCDFARLRERGDYVYVDKTDMLARLAMKDPDAIYFIARPRRFGKSLMLSTFKCMFEGRKELFRGLKIMKSGWDWKQTFPVIDLDMQEYKASTPEDLESALYGKVKSLARKHRLSLEWERLRNSGQAFKAYLEALGKKGRFVVLVDEYDVPLQGFLGTPEIEKVRGILHDFYSAFKSNVGSIRFLMMTGVSKFTKLSVFSSLNNLKDLTIEDGRSAALLGYTHDELKTYFSGHIAVLGRQLGQSPEKTYEDLLGWYDSYRFTPYSEAQVVNPVALGQAFEFGHLGAYWSQTGMPTLILERLDAASRRPDQLSDIEARLRDLDVCDARDLPWLPLLYQAGYLTIKDVTWETSAEEGDDVPRPVMTLGIPNNEVRDALNGQWWQTLMKMDERDFKALVKVAETQIAAGDIDGLICETLYQLYAKLPPTWTPKTEQDAKRYFLLFMEMAGARMQPERPSARGFADAVIETKKGVWIFEFKFNRSAASAIRQIRVRGYADAYASKVASKVGKIGGGGERKNRPLSTSTSSLHLPITLVGIKFDSKRKNIEVPKFEPAFADNNLK